MIINFMNSLLYFIKICPHFTVTAVKNWELHIVLAPKNKCPSITRTKGCTIMKRILTFWVVILVLGSMMNPKNIQKSLLQKTRESFEKVWNFLSLTWSMYVCRYLKQLLWICCCSVESAVICGLLNSMLLKNWELGALFFALQLRRRPLLLCTYEESERALSPLLECSSHNTTESRGDCSTPPLLYITAAILL